MGKRAFSSANKLHPKFTALTNEPNAYDFDQIPCNYLLTQSPQSSQQSQTSLVNGAAWAPQVNDAACKAPL